MVHHVAVFVDECARRDWLRETVHALVPLATTTDFAREMVMIVSHKMADFGLKGWIVVGKPCFDYVVDFVDGQFRPNLHSCTVSEKNAVQDRVTHRPVS